MPHRTHRRSSIALLLLAVLLLTQAPPAARAVEPPSPRLFASQDHVTIRRAGRRVYLGALPVWVASRGGAFELHAWRDDYESPLELAQHDAETGAVLRTLSPDLLEEWAGLRDFFRFRVNDEDGHTVLTVSATFCPASYERQRLGDEGPVQPVYPTFCSFSPFTRGTVWGIEHQWAISAFESYGAPSVNLEDGEYSVRVAIARPFVEALGVAPEDRAVDIDVTLKPRRRGGGIIEARRRMPAEAAESASVPDVTDPDPGTVPDLIALPSFSFETYRRGGRDYLAFAATEWNEGPSPLVVEGFRRQNEDIMDAYQYFYVDDEPVARANVGTLEFHRGQGHRHWHFEEFTEYTLLDAERNEAVVSGKQSWCLAPTDAIDLTVPGADWGAETGFGSACGYEGSLWVREHLEAGWGDTYYQFADDQAFDITGVPNGRYFVQTEVNPTGLLYEESTDNNIELRRIRLRGRPGDRRVIVLPWHGIEG